MGSYADYRVRHACKWLKTRKIDMKEKDEVKGKIYFNGAKDKGR
jgi:hypothetical protein